MKNTSPGNIGFHDMTRRHFLWTVSLSSLGLAMGCGGCAVDPVTGQKTLMLVSENQEIQIDRQYSPSQFSSDYGRAQDAGLNSYLSEVGRKMAPHTHRPGMPYNFQVVNATYVNAYAFPGGTIAATRGILLKMNSEAELAALLGHEMGHVNARHTAEQMSKGQVTSLMLGLGTAIIGSKYSDYADIAGQLGQIGAGMLLASYSRDNEREADALGNRYMVQAGYSTQGFVGLMEMLNSLSKSRPGYADILFSTHPMSDERYAAAVQSARTAYANTQNYPVNRERYMDETAGLRRIKDAIDSMQKGETAMGKQNYAQAESFFQSALRQVPGDYAGLAMMSKCLLAQKKYPQAEQYAENAKRAYPGEAQGYHLSGFAKLQMKKYDAAYREFDAAERAIPGNPTLTFFRGYCQEGMGNRNQAADLYNRYLQVVQKGDYAQHAYTRLSEWGYIRKK